MSHVCVLRKMTQGRNTNRDVHSTSPLELVLTNHAGPTDPASVYAVPFTDDYSGVVFVYYLRNKNNTPGATKRFLANSAPFGKV